MFNTANCQTPEDFTKAGFALYEPSGTAEYWHRIHACLPRSAPRLALGAMVYNPIANENSRISLVTWDRGLNQWRYCQPGYSTLDPSYGPRLDAAFVEYVVIGHCGFSLHTCRQQEAMAA